MPYIAEPSHPDGSNPPPPPPAAALFSGAAFGPDVLKMDPLIESRLMVKARPRDACDPFHKNYFENGAIALVERGTCNFTEKVTLRGCTS